ncbi:MAG: DUF2950 family protein [Planctomycetes bacterium]|nr:DUF2950 family protein [Planctomycetota bacterium]
MIEMLTVTTVIGILASVTVPTLISRRVAANESAVVATMRAVSQAQFQFQASGYVDANNDSGFEFGSFGELGGLDLLRGTTERVTKPLLSASLAKTDVDGHATLHGYLFSLFLPDGSGKGVVATATNMPSIDPFQARDYWTCLAWPIKVGTTGNRSFFVNQHGQVLKTKKAFYSGKVSVPPAGAGLVGVGKDQINGTSLATNSVGADGQFWIMVH